jgi:formylglycine-generating enzyme required for sulfatase activity
MFCPFCGTDNSSEQKYCRNCGATLPTAISKPNTRPHSAGNVPSTKSGTFVPPQASNFPGRRNTISDSTSSAEASDFNTRTRESRPEGRPPYRTPNLIGSEEEDILSTSLAMSAVRLPNNPVPPTPSNKQSPTAPPVKTLSPNNKHEISLPLDDDDEELRRTSLAISAVRLPDTKSKVDTPISTPLSTASSREDQLEILNTLLPGGAVITPPPAKPFSPTTGIASEELSPDLFANTVSTPSLAATEGVEDLLSETVVMDAPIPSNPFPNEHELDTGTMAALYSNTVVAAPAATDQEIYDYLQHQSNNAVDSFPAAPSLEPENLAAMYAPTQLTAEAPSSQDIQHYQQNALQYTTNYDPTVILENPVEDQLSETVIIENPVEEVFSTAASSAVDEPTMPLSGLGAANPDKVLSEEDPFRTVAVPFSPSKAQSPLPDAFDPFATASTDVVRANSNPSVSATSPSAAPSTPPASLRPTANKVPDSVATPQPLPSPALATSPPVTTPTKPALAPPPVAKPALAPPPTAAATPSTTTKSGIQPLMILAIAAGLLILVAVGVAVLYLLMPKTPLTTVKTTPPAVVPSVVNKPPITTPAAVNNPPAPAIPPQMVLVPAGEYEIGCDEGMPGCTDSDQYSSPRHTVTIAAFYIDQYEVTNEAYAKFLKETAHPAPANWSNATTYPGKPQDPVVNVSWEDASSYAKWARKRLPTEQEWEIAASGKKHLPYPWGLEIEDQANTKAYNANTVVRVGSIAKGKSEFGAFDMSGNVWEWTASSVAKYPNSKAKLTATNNKRVIRGGSFLDVPKYCTTYYRGFVEEKLIEQNLGFRCAKDAPLEKQK